MEEKKKNMRDQYHPAICAGLHIALEEDSANLSFEEDHKLGTGSKSIDCLIIKKDRRIKVKKDIGRIFRGHNLVEIKGYGDYLSINKFYRAFGYALFYKADTDREDSIDIQDITLTFISPSIPKKLIKHLKKIWNITLSKVGEGIYHLQGFAIPMQILVASELDEEENLLLKSLLMPLGKQEKIDQLFFVYKQYKNNNFFEKAIKFIIQKEKKNVRRKENMGPELRETLMDVCDVHIQTIAEEIAVEIANKKAIEMAEEKAKEMAEEKAKEMAEEKAIEMAEGKAREMAREMAIEMAGEMASEKVNELARKLLKKGMSCEEVSEYMELDIKKVEKMQQELLENI